MALAMGSPTYTSLSQDYTITNPSYTVAPPTAQPALSVVPGSGWGGLMSTGTPQPAGQAPSPNLTYNTAPTPPPPPQYYYSNGTSAGTGAAAQAAVRQAADTAAFYQGQIDSLNSRAGQLDNIQNVGLQNYQNSYNQNANRLDYSKAQARNQYDTSLSNNQQQYARNRTGIVTNTQANVNALQRLLGMNGAGNSSASYDLVPYAAGLQGTHQLADAQNVYGQNGLNLDNNWKNYQTNWDNTKTNLDQQNYAGQNSLRASIAQQRANILDAIATAATNRDYAKGASYQTALANQGGYRDQVNNLLSQISSLGNQYQNNILRVTDPTYTTPTVNQWLLNQNLGPLARTTSPGAGTSDVNPIIAPILTNQKRDPFGNVIRA